jgi:uncharacterized protein YgiM (DUF1202 family)
MLLQGRVNAKQYLMLLAAVWLMLGFAGLYEAAANETCTMYVHVRDGTYLNARHDATKDSAIEMRLHAGDAVEVTGIDGRWAQVKGGEAGICWCCVDYLATYPPEVDAILYTVVSNGRVRVRATPGGETTRYLHDGDTVTVRFITDGWAYLGDGYVMDEYLILSE